MSKRIEVALAIYTNGENRKCAFYEDNNELFLPYVELGENDYPANACLLLAKENIRDNLKLFDIMPHCFFDPIADTTDNNLTLVYRTVVFPQTNINSQLQWKTYEELKRSKSRIKRGHYEAYRTGVMF
jgi:hypothetical protein